MSLGGGRLLPGLVAACFVLAPAAALVTLALLVDDRPAEFREREQPVWTAPTERVLDAEVTAVLTAQAGAAPTLVSPGGQGVVTQVHVATGGEVRSGDPIYSLDGVQVSAMMAPAPPYRELGLGDSGPDVNALETYLIAAGYLAGEADDEYGEDTARSVSAYQADAGVQEPDGRFGPELVVWLPVQDETIHSFRATEVLMRPGQTLPGQGSDILIGEPPLTTTHLATPAGGRLQLSGAFDVTVTTPAGRSVALAASASDQVSQELQAALEKLLADEPGIVDQVTGEGLPVRLRPTDPERVLTVPASAVMVDRQGIDTCVWGRSSGAPEPVALAVQVTGGDLATAEIEGDLEGHEVLVNPIGVLREATCR